MPAMPIADSKSADRRRDETDKQSDQHRSPTSPTPEYLAIGHSVTQTIRKMMRQARQQDRQRQFVRRLLPLGALDERDHAVDEGRAGRGGDAHLDPIGEHRRAAGHGRAVAARFADDWRGFAGDRRFR